MKTPAEVETENAMIKAFRAKFEEDPFFQDLANWFWQQKGRRTTEDALNQAAAYCLSDSIGSKQWARHQTPK